MGPVCDTPPQWLEEAMLSIRGQVGVDDASQNELTRETLALWDSLPDVRVVRLPNRRGVGGALNAGWAFCRGSVVARLDADDVAHPERLQQQLSFLATHPSITILGGGFKLFRTSAELQSSEAMSQAQHYRFCCHPVLVRWHMLFSCSLAHPTLCLRRSVLGEKPIYPEHEEAEDHCCWLDLPFDIQMANIADVLTFLRRHKNSRSACQAEAIRSSSFAGVQRFLLKHCSTLDTINVTTNDIAVLWGHAEPSSLQQTQRLSAVLDAVEKLFLTKVEGSSFPANNDDGFCRDFLDGRVAGLQEYIRSSCGKLRGAMAMQSLATGDVSSGAEMVKQLLNRGHGVKSLGALISAGFPSM